MDWKSIISTLQERGLSQAVIAEKCGCAQPTISDLASGKTKQPGYALGQSLQKLMASKRKAAKVA